MNIREENVFYELILIQLELSLLAKIKDIFILLTKEN